MKRLKDNLTQFRLNALLDIVGIATFRESRPLKYLEETPKQRHALKLQFRHACRDLVELKYLVIANAARDNEYRAYKITIKGIRALKRKGYLHQLALHPSAA